MHTSRYGDHCYVWTAEFFKMEILKVFFALARLRSLGVVGCILWFAAPLLFAQPETRVPYGKPVMLNGQIDASWNDAASIELSGSATLYAKQSEEYVWLALKLKNDDGAVDLYISPPDGLMYDLHASAKLGERQYRGGRWTDWNWWNNQGWVANISRVDSFEARTFLPTNVREFQISKVRFPGTQWKMFVEFLIPAEPEWKVIPYPRGCTNGDTKGWLMLKFDQPNRRR
jgi:hypothetical protein